MTEKHEPSPPDTPEVEPVYEHFRLEYPSGDGNDVVLSRHDYLRSHDSPSN